MCLSGKCDQVHSLLAPSLWKPTEAAEPNLEADPGSCLAPTPALAPPQNPVTDEALLGQCLIATHNKTAETAMSVHLSFT